MRRGKAAETVLVTGGAGAIGSNLVRALLNLGHSVVVMDDLSSGRRSLVDKRALFVEGSVCDEAEVEAVFEHKPQYVFHLAALFANQNSVENPGKDLRVGGCGIVNVLQKCEEHRARKVLFVSSSCVYGSAPVMVEGRHAESFDTPYALTKRLGEMYCQYWSHQRGQDTVIVRLFNSYGPGEYPGMYRNVIPNFFELAMKDRPLPITGTGEEIRDFNFVEDTVQGIVKAMFSKTAPTNTFNIGSGRGTKIVDIAKIINDLTGNKAGVEFRPRRNWDQVTKRIAVIDKAKANLGYSPKTRVPEGLERTYSWLKSVLKSGPQTRRGGAR